MPAGLAFQEPDTLDGAEAVPDMYPQSMDLDTLVRLPCVASRGCMVLDASCPGWGDAAPLPTTLPLPAEYGDG